MTPEIKKRLERYAASSSDIELNELEEKCKSFIQLSSAWMERNYDRWSADYQRYRTELKEETGRKERIKKGQPRQVPMPTLMAQVDTQLVYYTELFTQGAEFFEAVGTGQEDVDKAQLIGPLLERDLKKNQFAGTILPAFIKDCVIANVGVVYNTWKEETAEVEVEQPVELTADANVEASQATKLVKEIQIVDQYNYMRAISPFHVLPDPRVVLWRYQEGEFCGIEDVYSKTQLMRMEAEGLVVGVKQIDTAVLEQTLLGRGRPTFGAQTSSWDALKSTGANVELPVIVTELQLRLKPKRYKLGDSNQEELWLVWMAGNGKIIRLEPMNYDHNKFTIIICTPRVATDKYVETSTASTIGPAQDTINWMLNGRLANLRQAINGKYVIDESAVRMSDVLDPNQPFIRINAAASGTGVDTWLKQLAVPDATASVLADIVQLDQWSKMTTGATDNLLGMVASGRRSATEIRSAISNSASRLKLPAHCMWTQAFEPLARQMVQNHRQSLSVPVALSVLGTGADVINALPQFFQVTGEQLPLNYDFVYNSSFGPSEKQAQAAQLREVLDLLLSKPELLQIIPIDVAQVLIDILKLQGLKHAERYRIAKPAPAPGMVPGSAGMAPAPTNAGVPGQEQVGNGAVSLFGGVPVGG